MFLIKKRSTDAQYAWVNRCWIGQEVGRCSRGQEVKMLKMLNRSKCSSFSIGQEVGRCSRGQHMLELLELWHLTYPRLLAKFGMLVFFANLSLMGFQVRYLSLFLLFSVIDGFKRFLMGSLHKNILLMQELLRAPSLVLNFSYYTLTTFLIMSSVILLSMTLLSMLLILLSILSAIRYLICSNDLNWLWTWI